jgi:predicted ATP-dependent protease
VVFSTGVASSMPPASSTLVKSTCQLASILKQGDIALKAHVVSVCFKYFRSFRGMLQVFYADVTKVDGDVASVSEACCKCFKGMLQAFV